MVLKYLINKPSTSASLVQSNVISIRMALFTIAFAFLGIFAAYRCTYTVTLGWVSKGLD